MVPKRIRIGLALLALTAAAPAAAEEAGADRTEAPRLTTGGFVALNLSSFSGDGIDPGRTHETKVGPAAGAFIRYRIAGRWSVEAQGLLSEKGARLTSPGADTVTANFHYLELPLLGGYAFDVDLPVGLHAYGGFSLNFLVGADARDPTSGEDRLREAARTVDVGIVVGAGATWPANGASRLSLGLRFQTGLRDFLEDADGAALDARHTVLSVVAGLEL